MRKLLLFAIISLVLLCGCVHDRGIILFNTQPITRENALDNTKYFKVGDNVYYLFIAPHKMNNKYIRAQVVKMADVGPLGGAEIVRTKDFRLMKDERYYHTDYFTFHIPGHYYLQVFSTDNLLHPLSVGDFYVR